MDEYFVKLLFRALHDLDEIYSYVYRINEAEKQVIIVTVRYAPSKF